jgi:hypothetical protein
MGPSNIEASLLLLDDVEDWIEGALFGVAAILSGRVVSCVEIELLSEGVRRTRILRPRTVGRESGFVVALKRSRA